MFIEYFKNAKESKYYQQGYCGKDNTNEISFFPSFRIPGPLFSHDWFYLWEKCHDARIQ